jgi:hypothetical protein
MNLRTVLIVGGIIVSLSVHGQTAVNRTIPVQNGQSIRMHFDYPELVKVSTWDKNEIAITGSVSINGGENDDAFVMENSVSGNVIDVRSQIRDIKNLPHRITLHRDGQTIIFKDKAELKKYQQEHGGGYNNMSYGPDIDIVLEIKVPRSVPTTVESVYGMVEVMNFNGPLTVDATYGGVDAALSEKSVGEIVAETNYGEIFTNFDSKFGGSGRAQEDFHMVVVAKPGQGPKYDLESKYGNVYIRKATN